MFVIFFINRAGSTGVEPAARSVHFVQYFHTGMDYIFTILFNLGALVSSLYGVLFKLKEFPRCSHIFTDLAFTVIPELFILKFPLEAALKQGAVQTVTLRPQLLLYPFLKYVFFSKDRALLCLGT